MSASEDSSKNQGFKLCVTTSDSAESARSLASKLVEERLVACVNIIPGLESVYRWEGKTEVSAEYLLLMKSSDEQLPALEKRLLELHSYDTPEFIAFEISDSNNKYAKWMRDSLSELEPS